MALKDYKEITNFSGGLNVADSPALILDNQVAEALNVVFGNGFVEKRNGYEQYGVFTPQSSVNSLYEFKRNNGTKEFLCAAKSIVTGAYFYKDDGVNSFENLSIKPGSTILSSEKVKYLTYKDRSINDVVLIADGGKLKIYDGSVVKEVVPHVPTVSSAGPPVVIGEDQDPGLNDLANLTNVRCLALKKDRIFLVGHPTVKNRVHFSWIDPIIGYAVYDYIPAIYFFDVAVEDNDEIVELKVFRNTLIIFCKKSVWALKGDGASLADLELIKINVPNGCIAPDSIQEVGNNIFYLADDHVYSLFASEQEFVSAQVMSVNVRPILKGVSLTDKALATSVFYDSRYWLTFPNGITLVYDSILQCWTKFDNIQANSFLVRDGVLYFGGGNAAYNFPNHVYRFDENRYSDSVIVSGSPVNTPINYQFKTKIFNFDLPINVKKFRRLWSIQKQYDGYISTYDLDCMIDQYLILSIDGLDTDFDTGNSAIWDESNWDEASWDFTETTQNKINVRKKGKDIQLIVSNNKVDEPLSIYGFVFEYEVKKPK